MTQILIIEDDVSLAQGIGIALQKEGYEISYGHTLSKAQNLLEKQEFQLLILDVNLPDGNGLSFCKSFKESSKTPVLMLTARDTEQDEIAGLMSGADDYITKPFGTAELQARVRAALRIYQQNLNRSLGGATHFQVGELVIDYDTRHVLIKGEDIKLTQTEYNIVALLAAYAGKVMTYSEIIKEIWKWSDAGSIKKLQVNMANIRKKMGIKPGDSQYIINELGVGYRMNVDIEV